MLHTTHVQSQQDTQTMATQSQSRVCGLFLSFHRPTISNNCYCSCVQTSCKTSAKSTWRETSMQYGLVVWAAQPSTVTTGGCGTQNMCSPHLPKSVEVKMIYIVKTKNGKDTYVSPKTAKSRLSVHVQHAQAAN